LFHSSIFPMATTLSLANILQAQQFNHDAAVSVSLVVCWDMKRAKALRWRGNAKMRAPAPFAEFVAREFRQRLPGCYACPATKDYEVVLTWVATTSVDISEAESEILGHTKDIIEEKFQLANGKVGRNIMGSIRTHSFDISPMRDDAFFSKSGDMSPSASTATPDNESEFSDDLCDLPVAHTFIHFPLKCDAVARRSRSCPARVLHDCNLIQCRRRAHSL